MPDADADVSVPDADADGFLPPLTKTGAPSRKYISRQCSQPMEILPRTILEARHPSEKSLKQDPKTTLNMPHRKQFSVTLSAGHCYYNLCCRKTHRTASVPRVCNKYPRVYNKYQSNADNSVVASSFARKHGRYTATHHIPRILVKISSPHNPDTWNISNTPTTRC